MITQEQITGTIPFVDFINHHWKANTIDSPFNGYGYDAKNAKDYEYITDYAVNNPLNVWTLMKSYDGEYHFYSGYHENNEDVFCYIITETPANDNNIQVLQAELE